MAKGVAMKSKSEPLKKGKPAAVKKTVVMKEAAKKPLQKGTLNAKALGKVSAMSLEERVANAVGNTEDQELAAILAKGAMTKLENSKVWSAHQTHLKHNPEEAEEFANKDRKSKGIAAALWYIKKTVPHFRTMEVSMERSEK